MGGRGGVKNKLRNLDQRGTLADERKGTVKIKILLGVVGSPTIGLNGEGKKRWRRT